jgi:hypothetical protein
MKIFVLLLLSLNIYALDIKTSETITIYMPGARTAQSSYDKLFHSTDILYQSCSTHFNKSKTIKVQNKNLIEAAIDNKFNRSEILEAKVLKNTCTATNRSGCTSCQVEVILK